MSSSVRTLLFSPRLPRTLAAARRSYATIPTKNPNPTVPLEPSREQAMPVGRFYEAIRDSAQPIPDVKPEEPATPVKEHLQAAEAEAATTKEPAKRGRKPKAKTEPASTATASSAPNASPAASQTETAKEAASKSPVSSKSPSTSSSSSTTTTTSSTGPSSDPVEEVSASSSAASEDVPPAPTPPPTRAEEKAKVIFGSRLAGPAERAERLAKLRSRSTMVAGVMVPPKPEEPDNCCMSGCVNCVWDRFRDEMEEWAVANAEAEKRQAGAAAGGEAGQGAAESVEAPEETSATNSRDNAPTPGPKLAISMDDDGGGSDTNWGQGTTPPPKPPSGKIAKDFWDEELYKDVPVGIKEFMKQEKRLKEKHSREGTSGG